MAIYVITSVLTIAAHPRHHSVMAGKSQQIQIRVTAAQKTRLRELARRAGVDVSAYVLSQARPDDLFVDSGPDARV